MKSKAIKILLMLMVMAMVVTMSTSIFAADYTPDKLDGTEATDGTGAAQSIWNFGQSIMNVLRVAGIVIAVIIVVVLGIRYMMGSTADKSDYKKSMMPYFIGAILIFAAPQVANMVFKFASGLKSSM